MRTSLVISILILVQVISAPVRANTVTVSLLSPLDGSYVIPGTPIPWTINAEVSVDDNYGLALICVDLVQGETNPEVIILPQADSLPEEMNSFDRPFGLANPPPPGATSGYLGTPIDEPGFRGLSQIGGAQNTFGTASKNSSVTYDIIPGVGQSAGGQIIAGGSIAAPQSPGTYRFRIESVLANTLSAVNDPPAFSPTATATIVMDVEEIVVHVCVPGDIDGDGDDDFTLDEIEEFVLALLDPVAAGPRAVCSADINADGLTNGEDVRAFVQGLTGGGATAPPPIAKPAAPPR